MLSHQGKVQHLPLDTEGHQSSQLYESQEDPDLVTLAHLGRESLVTAGPPVIPPGVSRISSSPLVWQVEGEGRVGRELCRKDNIAQGL